MSAEETPEVAPEATPETPTIDPHDLGLELPEDPSEAVQVLLAELAEARSEADSYLEDLRRVAADFENYRRRTLRDQAENIERAAERVVSSLLPVLDSLDAALATEPTTPTEQKLVDGMRNTRDLLLATLAREGLEVIPTLGVEFDPEVHEAAIAPAESGDGPLVVTDELRRGYKLHGRMLRPALVAVGHE